MAYASEELSAAKHRSTMAAALAFQATYFVSLGCRPFRDSACQVTTLYRESQECDGSVVEAVGRPLVAFDSDAAAVFGLAFGGGSDRFVDRRAPWPSGPDRERRRTTEAPFR